MRILLLTISVLSVTKGVPVADYELEKDALVREFLRSPEYILCVQNVFLPGSESSGGDKTKGEANSGEASEIQVFQECITQAYTEFTEGKGRRDLQKRSAKEQSNGESSGMPGISNLSVTQQCMQSAVGGNIPGFGGKSKRSPKDEGGNGFGSFAVPFSQSQYQECVQNALSGVPGASSVPSLGGGDKHKRSADPGDEEEGSSSIPGMSNFSATQQCFQTAITNSIPGKGRNSFSGISGFFDQNSLRSGLQDCFQNAVNVVPGASSVPGLGGSDKPDKQ